MSTRSKRKNISADPGPSSGSSSSTSSDSNKNEGGDGSKEYGVMCESDSMGTDESNCKESKSKRSRQAEPTLPITSGLSTAAVTDITRN